MITLSKIWFWLRDEHNRGALRIIGAFFAAVILAGWAIYTDKDNLENTNISISRKNTNYNFVTSSNEKEASLEKTPLIKTNDKGLSNALLSRLQSFENQSKITVIEIINTITYRDDDSIDGRIIGTLKTDVSYTNFDKHFLFSDFITLGAYDKQIVRNDLQVETIKRITNEIGK
jgi:hypothetical protein